MNRKQFGLILILLGGLLFLGQTQVPARIQLTGTSVVINEIHYNPDNVQGFDSRYEFAELYNNGSTAIDLSDWEFGEALTDVDNVDIPAGTMIAAGGYIIIAYTPATYNTTLNCPVVGHPDNGYFGLSNSPAPKSLFLYDENDTVVDTLAYDDVTPWPTSPDGEGTSLEKLSANGNNSASNWFASYNVGGTPCGQNSVSVGISAGSHSPWTPAPGGIVTFKVNATDLTGTITSVSVDISTDGFATKTTTSLTDSDSDGMWTGTFTTSSVEGTNYTYSFNTQNSNSGTGTLRNIFMNFTTMTFQPYISAFHAQGSSTDSDSTFVVITNPYGAVEDLDISWWYITDEGLATSFDGTFGNFASVWQFPANSFLAPGQSAFIAENGTQFEKDYGMVADYEMNGTSSASSMIKVLGGGSEFDLFEGGDEILLISSNAVIDAIKYSNFEPTSFDGDDFLSVSSSVQATDKFSRADSDTDDPANDFVQSTFPFVSLTNTTNGTTHVAGEVLSVASIDADGINSTMYNWDGGANATHSGSVAMPSAAGAHTLKLWANDSSGNWAYVTYVLTTGTPTAPVSTVPTTTTTTTTETTPTTTGTTTAVTTTATTTTTPAGTTTTPAATTSSTEDTDDGGFVPGFEIWVVLMSFSTLVAVRFRRKK